MKLYDSNYVNDSCLYSFAVRGKWQVVNRNHNLIVRIKRSDLRNLYKKYLVAIVIKR